MQWNRRVKRMPDGELRETWDANAASKTLALSCGFSYMYSEPKVDEKTGRNYKLETYSKRLVDWCKLIADSAARVCHEEYADYHSIMEISLKMTGMNWSMR